MEIIRNYIAKLDSKKRLTLRKTDIKYYEVKEYDNGCIVLEPRKLEPISSVSLETLQMLDNSAANYKRGIVSEAINLDDLD